MKTTTWTYLSFIAINLLASVTQGAMPISDPAALTYLQYTEETPVASERYGLACSMSDNFLLIGVRYRDSAKGGYDLFQKTPDMKWERVERKTYNLGTSNYGRSVALGNNTMLIAGTLRSVDGKNFAGSVMVRMKDNLGKWADVTELSASDPQTTGYFGAGLALDGDTIAIGAYGANANAGIVYIFTYANGSWTQTDRITPDDATAGDQFGRHLALKNNLLAIGAPVGEATYIYDISGGSATYRKTLTGGTGFGQSVAMSDRWLFVGNRATVGGFIRAGQAKVYDVSQADIPLKDTLTAPTPHQNDYFGYDLDIDGDLAVITTPYYEWTAGTKSGAAMVFQYDGTQWNYIRQLPYYDVEADMEYGYSVAVERNHIACGAPDLTIDGAADAGAFFIYDLNQSRMVAGNQINAQLGDEVAINQTHMAASADREDVDGKANAGRAYVYRRQGTDWIAENTFTQPAADFAAYNYFGDDLDLGRKSFIVSAPYTDISSANDGVTYIYERSGTTWEQKLRVVGTAASTYLGDSVAIDEPFAAITSCDTGAGKTYIHVYQRASDGTWAKQTDPILTAETGGSGFITDLAIDGNILAIGAANYDSSKGVGYIYEWNGSVWTNKVTYKSMSNVDFGEAVAVAGASVAFGAPGYASDEGGLLVYRKNSLGDYDVRAIYAPIDASNGDNFGYSLAFAEDGNVLVVSSYKKKLGDSNFIGATHTYRYDSSDGSWDYDGTTYPPDNGLLNSQSYCGKNIAAFGNTVAMGMYGYEGNVGNDAGGVTVYEIKPNVAPADFDGDGITDIGCYYAPGGNWYVFKSATKALWLNAFGYAGTTPFVNDFDGDWITDFGCFDPASGNWFFYGSTRGFWVDTFGSAGSTRITGDFDGDGLSDNGYFETATTTFRMMCSAAGYKEDNFGTVNGVPVTGDFDGDGIDDYGTYSAPSGQWEIRRSRDGDWSTQFGYAGTTPITGDFDGDNIIDFGCYYPPSGAWYIYKSTDGFWVNNFGYEGTTPVTGDFDGDGIDDFGCYYPPPGAWYVYKSTEGFWVNNFGYTGTVPMN